MSRAFRIIDDFFGSNEMTLGISKEVHGNCMDKVSVTILFFYVCLFFFHKFWHFMCRDLDSCLLKVLNDGTSPKDINQTTIFLIPKIKKGNSTQEFYLISLCNVIYNVISKTIVNRLKDCLHHVIHDSQSTFVLGRNHILTIAL